MHQRRGRVPAERIGDEEEHLEALRQVGVDVRGDPREAAVAEVAAHQFQVVGAAVGACFGRHGVEEVQRPVDRKYSSEEPCPGARERREFIGPGSIGLGSVWAPNQHPADRGHADDQEAQPVDPADEGRQENQQAQPRRAQNERTGVCT